MIQSASCRRCRAEARRILSRADLQLQRCNRKETPWTTQWRKRRQEPGRGLPSLMLVTALSPVIGYDKASKIAHYAMDNDLTLRDAALKLGFVSEAEFDAQLVGDQQFGCEALLLEQLAH